MNIYKDFLYNIRKMECDTPYLIVIHEYPSTYLYGYVKMIVSIPFLESDYNLYYGELRKIIRSFLNFYTICTGHAANKGEDYKNTLEYNKMMQLFNQTVTHHDSSHSKFLKEFQPIESAEEQEKFDTIVSLYDKFKKELLKFGEELKALNKQEKVDNFAKDHFTIGAEKIHQICDYSHVFIAKWLADHIKEIRISLEEILHRMRTNDAEFKKQYEDHLNSLYNELYELNKENVSISRQENRSLQEAAANKKKIETITKKIESFGNYHSSKRLNDEVDYWSRRLAEFKEITSIITKIKTALDHTTAEEKIHGSYETTDLPGTVKYKCWHQMAENLTNYKTDLEKKYIEAIRPLITFFSSKGIDHILYSDAIGSYYIDEYGHQNYITHYGAKYYHVNCKGEYIENRENDKYYFDKNGRYIIQDGKKIYQLAPCTSLNNLTENGWWSHIETCKCKDSSCTNRIPFRTCTINIHDFTDVELLPKTEIIDIEKTLDSETVKYLWHTFGWILPEILNDVSEAKPKNPIHYLAHLLLNRSHTTTDKEMKARIKQADKYRDVIIKQRKKEAEARSRAWKAKQIKPFKKGECDTSHQRSAYKAYQESQHFIEDLSMYYTE